MKKEHMEAADLHSKILDISPQSKFLNCHADFRKISPFEILGGLHPGGLGRPLPPLDTTG